MSKRQKRKIIGYVVEEHDYDDLIYQALGLREDLDIIPDGGILYRVNWDESIKRVFLFGNRRVAQLAIKRTRGFLDAYYLDIRIEELDPPDMNRCRIVPVEVWAE